MKKNHLNYDNGCMVSLHHTKPIGFGEGGLIVFDNKYKESWKKQYVLDLLCRINYCLIKMHQIIKYLK
jgi:dTDP-4-amino-4,6-dideoxygalactose transaminase